MGPGIGLFLAQVDLGTWDSIWSAILKSEVLNMANLGSRQIALKIIDTILSTCTWIIWSEDMFMEAVTMSR